MTPDSTRADEPVLSVYDASRAHLPVELPRPLSPSDAAIVRRIFDFQARGDIPAAVRATGDLQSSVLTGPILADRFLGRRYVSTSAELADWLDRFADLPEARSIHALLLTKLPRGATAPPVPDNTSLSRLAEPESVPVVSDIARADLPRANGLDQMVIDRTQRGQANAMLRLIASTRGLTPAYAARLYAEVAQVLFVRNEDADALRVVETCLRITDPADLNSLVYYVGGLAAWRMDRVDDAKRLFEGGAEAAISSPPLRAATAFWASRVNRRLQRALPTAIWLKRAATERDTLHGILARRMLRMDIGIVPNRELLTDGDVEAVAETPQGQRAFAFLQVDRPERAEAELRGLWPQMRDNPVFGRSVLMVAAAAGLSDFAAQLANVLRIADGHRFDELRFPIPHLRPPSGFSVDPALVYALTRTESNFNPAAISRGGARGLMQIMPATARYIAADLVSAAYRLHDPALNLEIGQRYVTYLAGLDGIDGDLIRLLCGYNAGPGNLQHWMSDFHAKDDPLLFIEAIPAAETRAFVPKVLAASWIYAARLHRPSPSLDSLAAGEFPRFTPLPREGRMMPLALRLN